MEISRINFTAEPNLLTKMQNRTLTQPVTVQANEAPAAEEPKKNNKVRNWSIGMGSAAILIGLGVLGHNGKLGKTMQKICGGKKKSLDEIADELVAELDRRAGRTADDITEAADRTAAGQAVKKGFPEIARTADDVTPEYIARVNASIDRTLPNLDDIPAKIEIPELDPVLKKELENFDISKLGGHDSRITLPNGNMRSINIINGKVSAVFDYNSNGEQILYAHYNIDGLLDRVEQGNIEHSLRNGKITAFRQNLGSRELTYNENGQLDYMHELNAGGYVMRSIYVKKGTKNISNIYYKSPTGQNIKIEEFIDSKLAIEQFTDENFNTLKEIRHNLSK